MCDDIYVYDKFNLLLYFPLSSYSLKYQNNPLHNLKLPNLFSWGTLTGTTACLCIILSLRLWRLQKINLWNGMIQRKRSLGVAPWAHPWILVFFFFSAAIGQLSCDFLLHTRVTVNHLQFPLCRSLYAFVACCASVPLPLASMGTEVNHAQQDSGSDSVSFQWLLLCTYNKRLCCCKIFYLKIPELSDFWS